MMNLFCFEKETGASVVLPKSVLRNVALKFPLFLVPYRGAISPALRGGCGLKRNSTKVLAAGHRFHLPSGAGAD